MPLAPRAVSLSRLVLEEESRISFNDVCGMVNSLWLLQPVGSLTQFCTHTGKKVISSDPDMKRFSCFWKRENSVSFPHFHVQWKQDVICKQGLHHTATVELFNKTLRWNSSLAFPCREDVVWWCHRQRFFFFLLPYLLMWHSLYGVTVSTKNGSAGKGLKIKMNQILLLSFFSCV